MRAILWPAAGATRAAALLLALVLVLFRRAVFLGEAFYERDITFDWYPQMEVFARAVAAASWPLWDSTLGFGQPLLASDAQLLYPPTWLNFVLRPWSYYTLFVVGHVWLSGVGVFALARRLEISPPGALAAAALWSTSGPLLSLVNLWHHFAGACWIPWVLLATVWLLDGARTAGVVALAAALAGQILAGSADMCAAGQLMAAALVLGHVLRAPGKMAQPVIGRATLAWMLAVAAAAPQWLPTLDAARRSGRWALSEEARTTWSLTGPGLLQTFTPAFLQDLPLAASVRQQLFDGQEPFLASVYLGLAALPLCAAALAQGPRRYRNVLAVVGALAVLFALGRHAPFYGLMTGALPVLRVFRYPVKAMILPALAFALLAGIGLDALRAGAVTARRTLLACAPAAVAVVGVALTAWRLASRDAMFAPVASRLVVSAGLGAMVVGLLAVAVRVGESRTRGMLAASAAALAVLDLGLAHQALNRTARTELLTFRPPVVSAILAGPHSRLYVYEYLHEPAKARAYLGREDAYVLARTNGLPLAEAQLLSQRLYPAPPSAGRWDLEGSYDADLRGLYPRPLAALGRLLRDREGTPAHLRLLQMGSVSHVVALHAAGLGDLQPLAVFGSLFPEPIRLFRVPDPLPRAYAVGGTRVADGDTALLTLQAPEFDPRREVILPAGLATPAPAAFRGDGRILVRTADRVRLEATLSHEGYLVTVDAFDPGWRVLVDGVPATPFRANVAFRAVRVPAGRHVVEWVYRPRAALIGLVLSAASVMVMLALAVRSRAS